MQIQIEDVTLDPITPSDYLVENAASYVTLGDYDGVEVTKYTYELTDDMVQERFRKSLLTQARRNPPMHHQRMGISYT